MSSTSRSESWRSGRSSRLTAAKLHDLEARSASGSSYYSGSTMISPKGTRYRLDCRPFSQVSSLQPEDSASNVPSNSEYYARRGLPRTHESWQSSGLHWHASRVSERHARSSNYPEEPEENISDSPYVQASHSFSQYSAVSRSWEPYLGSSSFDIEERAPSDYPRFQDMGYTGDSGGITRTEYEAIYGVPASKRVGISRSQLSGRSSGQYYEGGVRELEDNNDSYGVSQVSSRQCGSSGVSSAHSISGGCSRSNAVSLIRVPDIYGRY